MIKPKQFLYLIPSLVLMVVIFSFSNQPAAVSGGNSSAIVQKIMEIIFPHLDMWDATKRDTIANILEIILRKGAHMTEFAFLEISLFFGLYKGEFIKTVNKSVILSILIAFIYACSDEIHQLFVLGRSGQVTDVMIDMIGVVVAGLIVRIPLHI